MKSQMKVLIVDVSLASMQAVENALIKIGFNKTNINTTRSYFDASLMIEQNEYDLLVTDFLVQGRSGLELIQKHSSRGVSKISVIISANNSTAAIAEAAEELVDDYILKPFLVQTLSDRLEKLLERKLHPPRYIEEIRKGKQLLLDRNFAAAHMQFQNASFLDGKPTLAHYYMGQTSFIQAQFEDSLDEYRRGLEFRPLHFKCLTGQFDSLVEQKKFSEAYEMVPQLVENYPIGSKRLCQLFVAAVYAGRLEEVTHYYDLFLKIEHVTPELRRVFTAALFVAGKFYLNRQKLNDAVRCFDYGLQVVGADANYIERVVRVLVAQGKEASPMALRFLKNYPGDAVGGSTHQVLSYLVAQFFKSPLELMEMGRTLVQKNFADPECFKILIELLEKEGKHTLAEDYRTRAQRLFPLRDSARGSEVL